MNKIQHKSQFWAISSEGMNKVISSSFPAEMKEAIASVDAQGDDKKEVLRDMLSVYMTQRQRMTNDEGIAEVHLHGPMLSDASPIDLAMGSTSYEEIREDIEAANMDEDVKAILLRVNTPGGTVSGIEETYEAIKSSNKPVFAYNEGYATSAGYYLIAPAESIAASPSSMTGNIGTVLDMWDFSGMYENMGAKRTLMTNEGADLKGTMRTEPTDSQREFLQNQLNDMGDQFHARVIESRPDVDEEVYRAGWYQPDAAAALGLIDFKGTLKDYKSMIKSAIDIRTQ
jgi:protease IV